MHKKTDDESFDSKTFLKDMPHFSPKLDNMIWEPLENYINILYSQT